MTSFDRIAIEHMVRAHVGRNATVEEYDRKLPNSNMNLVLDHAARHVAEEIVLYWVANGPHEIFCLKSGGLVAIAFSERYVTLTSLLRRLMNDPLVEDRNIREELAERVLLRFMAEFALQKNQGDLAAQTFMKALIGQTMFLADSGGILAPEFQTRNEAYMAMWFYGVLHEVGHMARYPADSFETGALSDESLYGAVTLLLASVPHLATNKEDILNAARANSDHLLNSSRLRREGLADTFAASMLLQTSIQVLHRAGEQFAIDRFLMEQWMMHKIISALEASRLAVQAAVSPTPEVLYRFLFYPIAMAVRGMIMREHLKLIILPFRRGWRRKSRLRSADKLLDAVNGTLLRDTDVIDKGWERARDFVLSWRAPDPTLLKAFSEQVRDDLMSMHDISLFLSLADSFGTKSHSLDALRANYSDLPRPLFL